MCSDPEKEYRYLYRTSRLVGDKAFGESLIPTMDIKRLSGYVGMFHDTSAEFMIKR